MTDLEQNKIEEIQSIEHSLQNFLAQKQAIQLELNEVNNALEELEKTSDEVYKIIGNIFIKSDKKSLVSEITEKKKLLSLRIDSIEKQESILESRYSTLKEEISKSIDKSSKEIKK